MAQAPKTNKLGAGAGFYINNLGVWKIQVAQSGYLMAKKLDRATGDFEFVSGAVNKIRPETKMSLADAKRYGELYGRCIKCGRTLTDDESIAAGIGPICADKW